MPTSSVLLNLSVATYLRENEDQKPGNCGGGDSPARSNILWCGRRGRAADEFHHRVVSIFQRLHGFPMLFDSRLAVGLQSRHIFPMSVFYRLHVFSMLFGAALVVPVQNEKSMSSHSALRGPDDGGDPYGGSLHSKRGLLQFERVFLQGKGGLLHGEVCGFEYRHSAFSGFSPWSSLLFSLAQSAWKVKEIRCARTAPYLTLRRNQLRVKNEELQTDEVRIPREREDCVLRFSYWGSPTARREKKTTPPLEGESVR